MTDPIVRRWPGLAQPPTARELRERDEATALAIAVYLQAAAPAPESKVTTRL